MTHALVVEDKPESAYYLRVLLEAQGWTVALASHGAEALVKARQHPPDMVVSDLLMPVMDGYTLLRHWKADARLNRAPFVVYTATYTEPQDEQLALELGADAFFLKPCEPDELIAKLREVLFKTAAPPKRAADEDDHARLTLYSEALIRKLEEKTLQLAEANLALQRDIAARQAAEERLRQSEEQLRQAQKMQAVGQLAGGIAHDFNNLLTIILGYTSAMLDSVQPEDPLSADLAEIQMAGERASELTRQLLTFSQKQVLRPRVIDLNRIVARINRMLGRLLHKDVRLSVAADNDLGRVFADPGQLELVIVNLVVNARDAMPEGGSLTIETANATLDENYAAKHPNVTPGRYVRLAVTDTGHGMDAATRARIFEPFFTTKESGKGTGLGLATVYGIVAQSGGHLEVLSEPHQGATFRVYLPRVEAALDPEAPAEPPREATKNTETILVAEDTEQVRAIIVSVLRRAGYRVLEARDGREALLLAEQHPEAIQLLLTDLEMPHCSGRELAEALSPLRPQMKVLYMSGYTEDPALQTKTREPGAAFLPKPITPKELLPAIHALLHPAKPTS